MYEEVIMLDAGATFEESDLRIKFRATREEVEELIARLLEESLIKYVRNGMWERTEKRVPAPDPLSLLRAELQTVRRIAERTEERLNAYLSSP